MITETIYNEVLNAVESEIKLPEGWIVGSKTEDATDARYILCALLKTYGLSSAQIQKVTGLRKSTVNKILASYKDRIHRRKITHLWWLQIDRKLNAESKG